ncbi:MAG: RnfABCDGE type electron transport complex subunit D [Woeseiaceae bacterium]|nr:RnfABCDGE type electron transport complex subunit D [Woeseiaceae bacterium]
MQRIFLTADPRLYQIAVLGVLVAYGVIVLDFGIHWYNALAIAASAMLVQLLGTTLTGSARFDARSPLITALSLTMLLRTDDILLAAAAAAIAIGSKFAVRIRGKHVFNPANVAIVSLMFVSDSVWISTGQWGNAAIGALALACLGFIVLTRARRAETTFSFLIAYAVLLVSRALWLGDPLAIPLHHLQNGALLIFAFFMISDPKTTPNTPAGRISYGAVVAAIAFLIQFTLYQPNGPVIALILAAPLVPVIDFFRRGSSYQWHAPRASDSEASRMHHETIQGDLRCEHSS